MFEPLSWKHSASCEASSERSTTQRLDCVHQTAAMARASPALKVLQSLWNEESSSRCRVNLPETIIFRNVRAHLVECEESSLAASISLQDSAGNSRPAKWLATNKHHAIVKRKDDQCTPGKITSKFMKGLPRSAKVVRKVPGHRMQLENPLRDTGCGRHAHKWFCGCFG